MSDPEPSAAAASSSPPSVNTSEPTTSLNYAFLVHSQKTLTQNLPPRVDNKLLARQKRRRTSPEDHAILEAEYQRNPKPDKAARASIVSRVSLGEKEVQIWFQNRRQNDRRKSKPLQPHELVAPLSNSAESSQLNTSDDIVPTEPESSSGVENSDSHEPDNAEKDLPAEFPEGSSYESDIVPGDKDGVEQPIMSSQTSVATESHGNPKPVHDTSQQTESSQEQTTIQSDETHLNSAKRKRDISDLRGDGSEAQLGSKTGSTQGIISPPSLRISLSFDGEAMVRKEGELTPSPPKGRNALRIAMSSDGKAVIRAGDEPSPSRNRISMFSTRTPRFATGLRRSNSAVVLGTPRGSTEREKLFGRSRDPRNWESFFDTDARSALSTPSSVQSAPNAASPSLFRSRSQRSLHRSSSGRLPAAISHADLLSTPIPQQPGEKRRKLSRTVSSLGRLETGRTPLGKVNFHPKQSKGIPKDKPEGDDLEMHFGDSDKENWIPGTQVSHVRRRAASHHTRRPVLKDANRNSSKLSSGRRARNFQASKKDGKALPELSADVSAFMAGGSGPSQEEDLDCIQGLLSLSQGAWR